MRSGKPSVTTPIFLDQPDFAASLSKLGNGQATCQFHQMTANTLANKIRACLSDESIQKKAAEISSALRAEDGVQTAIGKIKTFVEGPMSNGEWLALLQHRLSKRRDAREAKHSGTSCFCFGALATRRS
ncbi:unnamed protein product [Prorocentrum cordatum]|uniref:Uncharacterized protein n=1 Tax=Prorocentrum cordatum TaxID=2364126 RepID=A0ABN9YB38_9DINO|nr:unnamed protein product [Polarella glacialis]